MESGTGIMLVEHGVHASVYEKAILSFICKYLCVVECCVFVSHAHFLLSNAYFSPRESAEIVAVIRTDDFVGGGKWPSLTGRFLWRISQGQPAAAHRYRCAFDICSPRSSSTQSKMLPVAFQKKPDSWIICGGLNVTVLYNLKLCLERTPPAYICFPFPSEHSELQQWCFALQATCNHSWPVSSSYFGLYPPSKLRWRKLEKGRRNWEQL